jgi:hypothetical protein
MMSTATTTATNMAISTQGATHTFGYLLRRCSKCFQH